MGAITHYAYVAYTVCMEKKKEKLGAWHDEPVHLDFISVHGPLRATEGVGTDGDSMEATKDTLEVPPQTAEVWREWTPELSRRAARTAFVLGELLDTHQRERDSVSA